MASRRPMSSAQSSTPQRVRLRNFHELQPSPPPMNGSHHPSHVPIIKGTLSALLFVEKVFMYEK
ncbi:hypothetical protein LY78DRAFT_654590 [Colletotrichum sublineola]|nr:hypothetical protein LY78DRAFT_654590 [Colletotrichum sublineola]